MKEIFLQILNKQYGLNLELANEIFNLSTPIHHAPKTILSTPEMKSRKAIYIHSGLLKYYCIGNQGEEIILNFRSGANFIVYSLSGFFMNQFGQTYCETLTECEGYQIEAEKLFKLADENQILYRFLLRTVTEVYQQRQIKEFGILEKPIKTRYIEFTQSYSEYLDIIPSKSIASYLNIQPGSLSRLRKNLNS